MNSGIEQNRKATKYSRKEQLLRVLWIVGRWVFQLTPRPCFGLRRAILRAFGARIGKQVNTYPSTHIYFPWNLAIDDYSSIGEWALIYNLAPLTIGKNATISQRAHLCGGTHDYADATMPLLKQPISVETWAWICADAFVGPNVTVGEGGIVAARAVVTKSVEPWTIVAGNPARVIKQRPKLA